MKNFMNIISGDVQTEREWRDEAKDSDGEWDFDETVTREGLIEVTKESGEWSKV